MQTSQNEFNLTYYKGEAEWKWKLFVDEKNDNYLTSFLTSFSSKIVVLKSVTQRFQKSGQIIDLEKIGFFLSKPQKLCHHQDLYCKN